MNYNKYKAAYFAKPAPIPRYTFSGSFGVTLYFEDYPTAVDYYTQVLGPPAYAEGDGTRSWAIGSGWLTLLRGKAGNPQNIEVTFQMDDPQEAERLQCAFITAGGQGPAPSDELMYEPVRFCPVTDPFGMDILIISPNQKG